MLPFSFLDPPMTATGSFPREHRLPTLPLPASGAPLWILVAIFLVSGSLGHDPWKIEDATHFGVIWRSLGDESWLTYTFATSAGGLVEPPLYYWAGRILGEVFSPLIGWPDAVRLASPLFAAIAAVALYAAARDLNGREVAGAAPLALIGTLGFLVQSHETQPMLAAIAAISLTYCGLFLVERHRAATPALLGAGLTCLVLGHGITLLPAIVLGMVAVAIVQYKLRTWPLLLAGLAISCALSGLWMWQLEIRSPGALNVWWAAELTQFGAVRMPLANAKSLTELLVWFAWPALPLSLWTIWSNRRRLGDECIALPLILTTLLLINVAIVFPAKPVAALAVLPALSLLAVPGLLALRRGAANAFDWFSRMTFSLIAGLIWLGWVAMNFEVPSRIARNFAKLAPGFSASVEAVPLIIAAAATAAWLWLIMARESAARQASLRPLAHWTSGIALVWVLTTSLWLPWIDYGKTYRSIASEIAAKTRANSGCITARFVGEAQFASLDYFLEHRLRSPSGKRQSCNWLLAQGTQREQPVGEQWQKIWEGSRPGDKSERFRLYRRN